MKRSWAQLPSAVLLQHGLPLSRLELGLRLLPVPDSESGVRSCSLACLPELLIQRIDLLLQFADGLTCWLKFYIDRVGSRIIT